MPTRRSDTSALVDLATQGGDNFSISVERIENGWLVHQSSFNPLTGEMKRTCVFSAKRPRIIPGRLDGRHRRVDSGNPLRDTVEYMKQGLHGA